MSDLRVNTFYNALILAFIGAFWDSLTLFLFNTWADHKSYIYIVLISPEAGFRPSYKLISFIMEGLIDTEDSWYQSTWKDSPSSTPIDRLSPSPEAQDPDTEHQKHKALGLRSRSLYEEYGTNEPYTKPEHVGSWDGRDPESFFKYVCDITGLCSAC